MTNSTSCHICSEFISDDEIAYAEWRNDSAMLYICDHCYISDMEDDDHDSYVLESAGWGTDEDYGMW